MVKAVCVRQIGGPEVLNYQDVELAPPGKGELQIQQRAIGVNYIDVYYRTGVYPAPTPFILGNEGAGDVIAIGSGVKDFKVGDRIAYAGALGGYAEARNLPAAQAVKLPKAITYDVGAAMMLKGLTAQYLLRQTYRVKPGDVILVHAAAGGVGLILCQWAKALGAVVIGTVSTDAKAKIAKKAGAKHIINYAKEDFAARVRDITKGKLCDVVYDGVGKDTFPASLDCIRPLGSFVSFGSASGPIESFNLGLLTQKGSLFATRPSLFTYIGDRERLTKMARELMKVVASGAVKINVNARYRLEQAQKAHEDLQSRKTTGAIVLLP